MNLLYSFEDQFEMENEDLLDNDQSLQSAIERCMDRHGCTFEDAELMVKENK